MIRRLHRRAWILPLGLSLFVDNLRGTPVRSAAVLLALAWALSIFLSARRKPSLSPLLPLFLLWSLAGAAFSVYRANTLAEWSLLAAAAALAAGFSVLRDAHPEESAALPPVLLGLGVLKALLVWRFGELGTPNMSLLGMFWVLGLILAWPARWGKSSVGWAVLAGLSLPLLGRWGMASAMVGLASGLVLVEGLRRKSRPLLAGAGAVALLLLTLFAAGPRFIRDNADDPRRMNRLTLWKDSAVYALHRGVLGTGLGTFEQTYPHFKTLPEQETANFAHNEWLQLSCELGLPGLAAGFFFLFLLGGAFRRRGFESPETVAALAALLFWSLVYYPFHSDPLLFAGALLAADLFRAPSVPWSRPAVLSAGAAALLAAAVSFTQGAAGLWEFSGGRAWTDGRVETALARFRTASRWNPLEPRLLDHQVECLRRLDRKAESLPLLKKAVALKPRDVWIRRKLAVALLNLESRDAALDCYAPILDLAPNVTRFRREFEELKTVQ